MSRIRRSPGLWAAIVVGYLLAEGGAVGEEPEGSRDTKDSKDPKGVTLVPPVLVPEPLVELPVRAVEQLPPPVEMRRRRWELFWGGLGITGVTWAADRLVARNLSTSWSHWLPVYGAWAMLSDQARLTEIDRGVVAGLAIDGIFQTTGVVFMIVGLSWPKRRTVLVLPPPVSSPDPLRGSTWNP